MAQFLVVTHDCRVRVSNSDRQAPTLPLAPPPTVFYLFITYHCQVLELAVARCRVRVTVSDRQAPTMPLALAVLFSSSDERLLRPRSVIVCSGVVLVILLATRIVCGRLALKC